MRIIISKVIRLFSMFYIIVRGERRKFLGCVYNWCLVMMFEYDFYVNIFFY